MVDITTELSPSTISSENPASLANSNAFRQARIFASSLSATASPLADRAAITSPAALRMTAPTPEPFSKMAASKFSLNSWPAGGFQFCRVLGRTNGIASELWASRYSLSKSVTLWFNYPGCCILLPYKTVLLLCQMSQLWTRKISSSSIDNLAIITWNNCIKSSNFPPLFCIRATDPAQTS